MALDITCKVNGAKGPDESLGVPHHVRQRAVHNEVPQHYKKTQSTEVHPAGNSSSSRNKSSFIWVSTFESKPTGKDACWAVSCESGVRFRCYKRR
jgi:hypothetical protein